MTRQSGAARRFDGLRAAVALVRAMAEGDTEGRDTLLRHGDTEAMSRAFASVIARALRHYGARGVLEAVQDELRSWAEQDGQE